MPKKALLWDMDGAALDTEGPAQCVWYALAVLWKAFRRAGISLEGITDQLIERVIKSLELDHVKELAECDDAKISDVGTALFKGQVPVDIIKAIRGRVLTKFLTFHKKNDQEKRYALFAASALVVLWKCVDELGESPDKLEASFVEDARRHTHPEQLLRLLGIPVESCIEVTRQEFPGLPYSPLKALRDALLPAVLEKYGAQTQPGVVELIQAAKKAGVSNGLATSSKRERAEHLLGLVGLWTEFDASICGKQEAGEPKPSGECWRRLCQKLNVDPQDCIGIEDSPDGIRSLIDAGVGTIIVVEDVARVPDDLRDRAALVTGDLKEAIPFLTG